MTKADIKLKFDIISGRPFIWKLAEYDLQVIYSEIRGRTLVVSNGIKEEQFDIQEINEEYMKIDCFFTKITMGNIFFNQCELK